MPAKVVCTVYDSKADAWIQPFFSATQATAIRSFRQAANEEAHVFKVHAADYTLFEIGTWDEFTGTLSPYAAKVNLGTALEHMDLGLQMSQVDEPSRLRSAMGGE